MACVSYYILNKTTDLIWYPCQNLRLTFSKEALLMTSSNWNISALLVICAGNSPVNSMHKGLWRGALMFSLICVWINAWVNNREAGDLRRHRAHYDVTIMWWRNSYWCVFIYSSKPISFCKHPISESINNPYLWTMNTGKFILPWIDGLHSQCISMWS